MAFARRRSGHIKGPPGKEWRARTLGQNFLTNDHIAERIASSVPQEALPIITEIGPGKGMLTWKLIEKGGKVKAVELDGSLVSSLRSKIGDGMGQLEVVHGNALDHIDDLFKEPTYLVANLPFNISSDLFYGILERLSFVDLPGTNFMGGIVMVQEEFGKRLMARPGGKDYGRLSVCFQSKMDFQPLFKVKRGNFDPVPDVDAIVVRFSPKKDGLRAPEDERMFDRVLTAAFTSRRKKLINSLSSVATGYLEGPKRVRKVLEDLKVQDKRPEQLSVYEFMDIADGLIGRI